MTLHRKIMNEIADLYAHPPQINYQGVISQSHYLTMRDGIQLAIDVMMPTGLTPETRLPVIMIMARYWRSMELRVPDQPNKALQGPRESIADYLIPRGFVVVVVDARGTGASTGVNRYPWSPDELQDYGEVARWVTAQLWCNGNIGALGISYEGSTAQYLVTVGVEAVKAVAPMEYEYDVYSDVALPGGIFNEAFIQQWNDSNRRLDNNKTSSLFPWLARMFVKGVRPVDSDRDTRTILTQALHDHQANTDVFHAMSQITFRDDPFGATGATLDDFSVFNRQSAIDASQSALFIWGSWLDGTTADTVLRSFNTLSNPQIGVIGGWKHEMTAHGSPYLKPNAKPSPAHQDQWSAVAAFFDETLNREEMLAGKTLFYYTLGEEKWKQTDSFPLPNTITQSWYFQENNGLSQTKPSQANGSDNYTIDFEATTGLTNRWHTQMARPLIYPNRASSDRRLLTYTSSPLADDLEITGYPQITLYVASTEDDGSFFVYLEDVDEKGVVRYITEGQLRAIHRYVATEQPPYWMGMPYHTFKRADAQPLERGELVECVIGLQPTSVLIRKGHQIRVAIGGADKDTFRRIPADGTPTITIARHALRASMIQLPSIPR